MLSNEQISEKSSWDKGSVVTMKLVGKIKYKNIFMPIIHSKHISLGNFLK